MFNVYTNVHFNSLFPDRRGISVSLTLDAPPGRARDSQPKARVAFWEGMSGKRMMQGGLIALVWKSGTSVDVYLGVLASSLRDVTDSVKQSKEVLAVRVVFFDSSVELRILSALKSPEITSDTKLLVEAPIMFEAIKPFLEALCVEPETIPFGRYLAHRPDNYLRTVNISPPSYACIPGFRYQLSSLFAENPRDLMLSVNDPASIDFARQELRRPGSRLDPSQADSVISALTREVTLIQGCVDRDHHRRTKLIYSLIL